MDTVTHQEVCEFIDALTAQGLTPAHIKNVAGNAAVAARVVALCDPGTAVPAATTSLAQAKAIMGSSFHDPAQWASKCGFRPTKAHKATFAEVPFGVELLKLCQETHLLVPILKLSIMQLHGKFTELFYQEDDPWYSAEAFATEQAEVGWMLIRREVVPGSTNRNWTDQQALIPEGEHVPTASELVQAVICRAVLTEERLLTRFYARTSSVGSDGRRVDVGLFAADGLSFSYWYDRAYSTVGLSTSRK